MLGSLVDLDIFERSDDQAAETNAVQVETGMDVSVEGLVVPDTPTGEEMLATANEALNILTDISFPKNAEYPGEIIDTLFDKEAYTLLGDGLAESTPDQETKHDAQDRILEGSIKDITEDLMSVDPNVNELDINQYATSSFKESVDEFDKEFDEHVEVLEAKYDVIPEEDKSTPVSNSGEAASINPSIVNSVPPRGIILRKKSKNQISRYWYFPRNHFH